MPKSGHHQIQISISPKSGRQNPEAIPDHFFTGHPLFQGVSHDLPTVLLSFLACPSLFGPSIVLASSNQRLAIRRRLIIMRAWLLGRGCRVVVVELRCRVI